ncbi:MAG: glutamyl-tRNA amidotransferase [Betaproteobacteria bacterium]|nr:glutamyl-tRNA amidotransferase [Betaproteobacteria bacterium]
MNTIPELGLREIAAGVRDRRWSAREVITACAQRIEVLEPRVRAWETLALERAFARADALDATGCDGALAGVPLAIKDLIDVAGLPTRYGSPLYASASPASVSASCVAALERAGAIILGKSVTTEFAYYTPGKARNPWNIEHTPGGSSMGSAASVACGMAAGALGTQTNGSVVRPAAFCGVVGFKPSFGSVSNHGTLDPWPTLDHTGVFARSVADAAVLAAVIVSPGLLSGRASLPERAPRLALVRSPVWHLAQAPQREMLASNANALERAGAQVSELELPASFERAHAVQRLIMAFEAARHFGSLQARNRDGFSVQLNALIDEGAAIDEPRHREALAATEAFRAELARTYRDFDALITPPAAGEAPATLKETGSPAFCTIWTLLGVPAITFPVGLGPAGLPLGLQVVGHARDDERMLQVAAWCESHLPLLPYPDTDAHPDAEPQK